VPAEPGSYAAAGVDIAAGDRAVDLMRAAIRRTSRPEVVGGIGGFAGLFDASALSRMQRPLLATSTDGVGTKVMLAARLQAYDTIGVDLVGMVVDDLVVCGAEPLFMTDYAVFGKVSPERVAAIVGGIARGCVAAGCALIGGETAEHPGHLRPGDFDLAGAATGVVDAARLLGAHRVQPGDVVPGPQHHRRAPRRRRRRAGQPGPRRRASRPGAAAGPGTAGAHPHLRPGLPRPGRRRRRARDRARHRGRAGRQPGQSAAAAR
jgi:hypothetical protein